MSNRYEHEYEFLWEYANAIKVGEWAQNENMQMLMIPPQKVIRIIQIMQMRTKRMNMKSVPGLLWQWKQWKKNTSEFEELTETFTADSLEAYLTIAYLMILPKLWKDLQSIYLDRLLWIAQIKKEPIHKQIMKTKDAFVNDDILIQKKPWRLLLIKENF